MPLRDDSPTLLVGTRKGVFLVSGDAARDSWTTSAPMFLGHIAQHVVLDPRDRRTAAARRRAPATSARRCSTPTTSARRGPRRRDPRPSAPATRWAGASSRCSGSPPGTPSEPGVWFAGGSPQGLFRTATAGPRGIRSTGGTIIRCGRRGRSGPSRTRPTDRCSTPSTSIHAIRRTCTSGCPPAASSRRPTAARLAAAQRRLRGRLLPRPGPRVRPRPSLRAPAPAAARPALPAEPLRHLPDGRDRGAVGADRRQHARRRRRHRIPDRAASPRSRHRVGVPDGRHRRVAAHQPRRPAGRLRHARRRRVLEPLRRRTAPDARGSR